MQKVTGRVHGVLSFFSVGLLLGSLFAPFRQISAGRVQGSLQAELQAFGDKLFSRFMGAIIRSMLIIIGLVITVIVGAFGLILIVAWPLIPVAPLIGVFLMQARFGA